MIPTRNGNFSVISIGERPRRERQNANNENAAR